MTINVLDPGWEGSAFCSFQDAETEWAVFDKRKAARR